MDSRRFLLAVVLMIAVMVVTNILLPPPPPPPDMATADSLAQVPADSLAGAPTSPQARDSLAPADSAPVRADTTSPATGTATADATAAPGDTVVARSDIYRYMVSTRGATILDAALLEFESLAPNAEGRPATLARDSAGALFTYSLRLGTRQIDLGTVPFTASDSVLVVSGDGGGRTLELRHAGDDAAPAMTVAYTFDPERYTIDARIAVDAPQQTPMLFIGLPSSLAFNEATPQADERDLAYVANGYERGIVSTRLASVDAERTEEGPLHWAAVKNAYFVAAALTHPEAPTPFGGLIAQPSPQAQAANLRLTLLPAADGTFAFRLYVGPQEPQRLATLGNDFEDVNPFGWRLFRPILRPLGHAITSALYGLHDLFGLGYGWVLILFGVLIRLLMWPLNAKAMRSQLKNMEIQPRLKELQAKYKKEPERLQKEMLRLYKEEGFNPMGGCLPMLVPMPILITLFFVFQSTIAFRGVEFLWLPDLSQKDPLYILPILLGVSMFLMQWLSSRSMTEQNPQMKFMMYAMPIFMTVLFVNFASGLNLYYASMNFGSIPQQLQIMRERQRFQAARR